VVQPNVINIIKDGSTIGRNAGAAAVIIRDDTFLHQSMCRLHDRSFSILAGKVTILRTLEQIQNIQLAEDAEKIVVVNREIKVTLDTLRNRNKHYTLVGNVRKEIKRLEDQQWRIHFKWFKSHVGIQGNEVADRLAKEVAMDDIGELV